ncbi:MAG: hypothetical protein K9J42_07890 [Sulfuritalea sp.]|nr:hypothetical protein [Sulfuritalea sp.]
MRASRIIALPILFVVAQTAIAGSALELPKPNETRPILHAHGYGPVQVGMTVARATEVLGIPLVVSEGETVNRECYHVQPQTGPTELHFMVQRGRIVRVSLYQEPSAIPTDRGIRLGSSIDAVRSAYKKTLRSSETWLLDEEHEYLGPVGRYLTWWDKKQKYGIRYETDTEGKVDKIHAGGKAITLIEGCS